MSKRIYVHLSVTSAQEATLVNKLDGYNDKTKGFENCFAVRDTMFYASWKINKDYLTGAYVPEEWSDDEAKKKFLDLLNSLGIKYQSAF